MAVHCSAARSAAARSLLRRAKSGFFNENTNVAVSEGL